MPTLALTTPSLATEVLGQGLERRGIVASAGLQCAPLAHEHLGTGASGALRLSAGPHTTVAEVDAAVDALIDIVEHP